MSRSTWWFSHSFVPFSVSFILENIYRNVFNEECTLNASHFSMAYWRWTKCFEKMYLYLISLKAYRQLSLYSSSSTYQSEYSLCCHDIVIFKQCSLMRCPGYWYFPWQVQLACAFFGVRQSLYLLCAGANGLQLKTIQSIALDIKILFSLFLKNISNMVSHQQTELTELVIELPFLIDLSSIQNKQ